MSLFYCIMVGEYEVPAIPSIPLPFFSIWLATVFIKPLSRPDMSAVGADVGLDHALNILHASIPEST
jgi:hypothetical protein